MTASLQVTEGVIPDETRGFPERAVTAGVAEPLSDGVVLALRLQGGRQAELSLTLAGRDQLLAELTAEGDPLRLAFEWDLRSEERFNGLGAHHAQTVDHREREVQLGAARRYTGPDCPADMLEVGGFPQGDYAPAPWLQSSRGYAVWCDTHGNGTRFDIGGSRGRTAVSIRSGAARCACVSSRTPLPPRACGATCGRPGCRRCSRSGAMASGSRAMSTNIRTTSSKTCRDVAGTASRSTPWCSIRRGRPNTTRGSRIRTSSRTSRGWSRGCARLACARSSG